MVSSTSHSMILTIFIYISFLFPNDLYLFMLNTVIDGIWCDITQEDEISYCLDATVIFRIFC